MKEITGNGLSISIAQAIAQMEAENKEIYFPWRTSILQNWSVVPEYPEVNCANSRRMASRKLEKLELGKSIL